MAKFKLLSDDSLHFTDENGKEWIVPKGHRLWVEHYEPFLQAKKLLIENIEEEMALDDKPAQAKKRAKKVSPKSSDSN
jgi:hypothetical protein